MNLIGFSDPIYAEAYVKVQGFDILLGKPMPQVTGLYK